VFFAPQARDQASTAMPDDPLYQASFICANLRLPTDRAQRLLEAPTLVDRFRAARAAIDARISAHDGGGLEDPFDLGEPSGPA